MKLLGAGIKSIAETVLMRINALVTENEVLTQGYVEKADGHKPRTEA